MSAYLAGTYWWRFFLRRGWSGTRARLATMALFAAGLPISALGVVAKDLWTAVAFISIATAGSMSGDGKPSHGRD